MSRRKEALHQATVPAQERIESREDPDPDRPSRVGMALVSHQAFVRDI